MNDLLQPEDIIRGRLWRLFHRHKVVVTHVERHPTLRGMMVEHRVCMTCGPIKDKNRTEY